jgi:hypothetical protein
VSAGMLSARSGVCVAIGQFPFSYATAGPLTAVIIVPAT